jgi:hypothetical protein
MTKYFNVNDISKHDFYKQEMPNLPLPIFYERSQMTPTPEQIAEWREAAELAFPKLLRKHYPHLHTAQQNKGATFKYIDMATEGVWQSFEIGYLRARTEQATEIAELKAKLAEVMPLAKFGAYILKDVGSFSTIKTYQALAKLGFVAEGITLKPEIEAAISKLLKD